MNFYPYFQIEDFPSSHSRYDHFTHVTDRSVYNFVKNLFGYGLKESI